MGLTAARRALVARLTHIMREFEEGPHHGRGWGRRGGRLVVVAQRVDANPHHVQNDVVRVPGVRTRHGRGANTSGRG